MKNIFLRGLMSSYLLALPFLVEIKATAQTYDITNLGAFLGTNSYAYGINNQGQVVGYWMTGSGARAFLYDNGLMTDLGSVGGANQYALSINSSGEVTGFTE